MIGLFKISANDLGSDCLIVTFYPGVEIGVTQYFIQFLTSHSGRFV